jgi:chemotaxis response regulator CheB
VVAYSTTSTLFLEKVQDTLPDFLILDIELINDSMSGLDIAKKLKLPVIFVSGKNAAHLPTIENLKFEHAIKLDFISKPYNDDHLKKLVTNFMNELERDNKNSFIRLKYDGETHNVPLNSIVCICTDKKENSESNNKVFYFNDRCPKTIADFSFSTKIVITHKSYRINKTAKPKFIRNANVIEVLVMNENSQLVKVNFPISESYISSVRKQMTE